jgi:hypothetical protein
MATKPARKKKKSGKRPARKNSTKTAKRPARRPKKRVVVEAVMGVDAPAPIPPPHKKTDRSGAFEVGGESGEG